MANNVNPKQGAQENITGAVREYVGARYVPLFADPITWDNTQTYEPLTIVVYQGNSYTSRQYVPTGIEITNTDYWALTGNYNAQIEQYRSEVQAISTAQSEFESETTTNIENLETANTTQDATITQLTTKVESNTEAIAELDAKKPYMIVIGDSFSAGNQTGTPYWWQIIAQRKNLEPKNYAVSGCGYLAGTKTFIQQINEAITEFANNKDEVAEVYVFGSINDLRNQENVSIDWINALKNVVNTLTSNFTQAKIYIIGPTSQVNDIPVNASAAVQMSYWSTIKGCIYLNPEACFNWLPGFYQTENNNDHPSTLGSAIIASWIMSYGNMHQPLYQPDSGMLASHNHCRIIKGSNVLDLETNHHLGLSINGHEYCVSFVVTKEELATYQGGVKLYLPCSPNFIQGSRNNGLITTLNCFAICNSGSLIRGSWTTGNSNNINLVLPYASDVTSGEVTVIMTFAI